MKIIHGFPVCISRRRYGIWRVIAYFADGSIHVKDYEAFTMAQAKRSYLMEFGPVIRGKVDAFFLKKS